MQFDDSGALVHTESQIRDHVFPLVRADLSRVQNIYGTAFMAGPGGYALTAAHCVPEDRTDFSVLFSLEGRWAREPIAEVEKHPTEDVALLRLTSPLAWRCFFRLYPGLKAPPTRYRTWGYPEDTYYEEVVDGRMFLRPDIAGATGEVRRGLPVNVPGIRGRALYELGSAHGGGTSGSPLVVEETPGSEPRWDVLGVYVGERTTNDGRKLGLAVRAEHFGQWVPAMLGRSLFEHCNPAPVTESAA